jgi:hypothetical protein
MTRRRTAVTAALVIVAVAAGVQGSAAADRGPRPDFDAVALSIPQQPGEEDSAHEVSFATARASRVRVSGVATASVTCDGCAGSAVTVQVVGAAAPQRLVARNVATAWSAGCTGCDGLAVSIQVVMAESADALVAANRALALNAACLGCRTQAVAVQFVFLGVSGEDLSSRALDQLYTLRDALALQLRQPARWSHRLPVVLPQAGGDIARQANTSLVATAQRVRSVLAADLHAVSARDDVKVARG